MSYTSSPWSLLAWKSIFMFRPGLKSTAFSFWAQACTHATSHCPHLIGQLAVVKVRWIGRWAREGEGEAVALHLCVVLPTVKRLSSTVCGIWATNEVTASFVQGSWVVVWGMKEGDEGGSHALIRARIIHPCRQTANTLRQPLTARHASERACVHAWGQDLKKSIGTWAALCLHTKSCLCIPFRKC